ncbi:MAG: nuclease-related domain-containing protein [Nitrospira sp.]|nr:nuclease-related domain-containing protein [Nitrospira sp.]
MAKIYRKVGSLTQLIDELEREGIGAFRTLDEIRSFRNNCESSLNRIREECREILRQEVADLESKYNRLSLKLDQKIREREALLHNELEELRGILAGNEKRNMLMRFFFFFRKKILTKKKEILENSFEQELRRLFGKGFAKIASIRSEIEDRKNNTEDWVERYSASDREEPERILSVFRRHKYLFYGAEGEERVARELSNLPDSYTVINDYRLEFSPPVYDRNNNDRIYSIQVDHVVVGPTGLYLVETKNWSRDSVGNTELFSPIKQLRRSNDAIFRLLNKAVERGDIDNFSDHWGDRKISPKNILCLLNHRPNREFQYVRILSENQITHYVGNQRQTFSQMEVESLAEYLLSRVT